MNSRERLRAALNHQTTDRIPADFCGTGVTGISASALYPLRQCLEIALPVRVYDVYASLAEIDELLAEALGSDTLRLPTPQPLLDIQCLSEDSKKRWKSYALEDGTPILVPCDFYPEREYNGDLCIRDLSDKRFALLPRGGFQFSVIATGVGAAKWTPEQIQAEVEARNPAVGFPRGAAYWNLLRCVAEPLAKSSGKALVMDANPFSPFFAGLGRHALSTWLELLAADDANANAVLDLWLRRWLEELEKLAESVGDAVDVLVLSDDFSVVAMQEDEMVILQKILPRYAEGISFLREKCVSAKILWQSAGNVLPYIPTLLSMGVDALGLVDLSFRNLNVFSIKREFGRDLALWGGACSAEDLETLSVDLVLDRTREAVDVLSEGGGYVHSVSGNILPGTRPDKVLTFFSRWG